VEGRGSEKKFLRNVKNLVKINNARRRVKEKTVVPIWALSFDKSWPQRRTREIQFQIDAIGAAKTSTDKRLESGSGRRAKNEGIHKLKNGLEYASGKPGMQEVLPCSGLDHCGGIKNGDRTSSAPTIIQAPGL